MGKREPVFPALAGMSPAVIDGLIAKNRVPRVGGDEPRAGAGSATSTGCSPRWRG